MLSINQKKYVNSLKQKKYRQQHQAFVVEGEKMVNELIESDFEIEMLFVVQGFSVNYEKEIEVSIDEMKVISSLSTPSNYLAVVKQKKHSENFDFDGLILALDNIKDPGNLGTIIRTADWFGVNQIVCSNQCVDVFNSKVVQATMGSIFRINIVFTELSDFFKKTNNIPVYGALLEGDNVYKRGIKTKNAILLMGSESFGINTELLPFITHKIMIPKYGQAESLNVAVATGVLCSEYQRLNY
ncbi:MAG: TrmH family RNA methyltransferase [Flavobacteriales bacterium]